MSIDTDLFTCVAKCKVCGAELDRASGVPDAHRVPVTVSIPISARCEQNAHNTSEKKNLNIVVEWYLETSKGLIFIEELSPTNPG